MSLFDTFFDMSEIALLLRAKAGRLRVAVSDMSKETILSKLEEHGWKKEDVGYLMK